MKCSRCSVQRSRRTAPPRSWSPTPWQQRPVRTGSLFSASMACMPANKPVTQSSRRIAGSRLLVRWLLGAEWRSHPARAIVAIATIALGVALGYAVQLINSAAFNEFSAAAKSLSGEADLQVRGAQPHFDESWYPRLATEPGVALASPVLDLDATVPGQGAALK